VAAGYSSYAILEGCERAGSLPHVTWVDFCDGHGWDGNHHYALGLVRGRYGVVPDDRILNSRKIESFEKTFDLVHVDGDHTYEGCLYDLDLTSKHLAADGCIVCHDTNDQWVTKAINYFLDQHGGFHVLNVPQVRCGVKIIYRRTSDVVDRLWKAILAFGS